MYCNNNRNGIRVCGELLQHWHGFPTEIARRDIRTAAYEPLLPDVAVQLLPQAASADMYIQKFWLFFFFHSFIYLQTGSANQRPPNNHFGKQN